MDGESQTIQAQARPAAAVVVAPAGGAASVSEGGSVPVVAASSTAVAAPVVKPAGGDVAPAPVPTPTPEAVESAARAASSAVAAAEAQYGELKFTRAQLKANGFTDETIDSMAAAGQVASPSASPTAIAPQVAASSSPLAVPPAASSLPQASVSVPVSILPQAQSAPAAIPGLPPGFDGRKFAEMQAQYDRMSATVKAACDEVERLMGVEQELRSENGQLKREVESLRATSGQHPSRAEEGQAAIDRGQTSISTIEEAHSPPSRPSLGLELRERVCRRTGCNELVVKSVYPAAGAADAGARAGDIIRRVNGVDVHRKSHIRHLLRDAPVGSPIRVHVDRPSGCTMLTICTHPASIGESTSTSSLTPAPPITRSATRDDTRFASSAAERRRGGLRSSSHTAISTSRTLEPARRVRRGWH